MTAVPNAVAPTAPMSVLRDGEPELRVDIRTEPPGVVRLGELPDNVLKVHAGAPVRGTCGMGRRFLYTRGDLDIFPAGSSGVWEDEDPSTSVFLMVPPALLGKAAAEVGLEPERARLDPRYQFRSPQLEHIAWALEAEFRAGFPGGRLYTDSLGMALAVQLLGHPQTQPAIRRGLSRRQFQRVTGYIEAHLAENLSLARLSAIAGLSASHFRVLFKRTTGLTVHAYVVRRRVERARVLLEQSGLPAVQVALEAGFSHQSHMARCMRDILGMTPKDISRAI